MRKINRTTPRQRRIKRARRIAMLNSLFVLAWAIAFCLIYAPMGM